MNKCVENKTNHPRIKVGENYELFEHENRDMVWVKVLDSTSSVGYVTIQAYLSDFRSLTELRDEKLDAVL